eukprot:CAMPEP_0205822058 /NCGR_PEP_ID=MMETSP0206-20130828/10838_1 /ASSEMBLY_ACC=CAM_ASM_000279 /TAXON_ID=36767 /ORGANISM="Euplotes focardii, Strain TN1" /LENGTH=146 /DNA_ID=CAMNT_0053118009 /DNA_START=58 /DNA_END=495 /DNA_ORIENTATION=-
MSDSHLAKIRWAQRVDKVLLKIDIVESKGEEITFEGDKMSFSTTSSSGQKYHLDLEFFGGIDGEGAKWIVRPRYIEMMVPKKAADGEETEFWPRITKEKRKYHNIAIDWNLWKDEDDEDDDDTPDPFAGGMPPGMGGGGMPGMGGM